MVMDCCCLRWVIKRWKTSKENFVSVHAICILLYVCIVVNDINAENIIVYHRDDEIFIL